MGEIGYDVVRDVLARTATVESPETFIKWAVHSAIAGIAKKSVYVNKGGVYPLFPNLYVFLIGKSGAKKGFPIGLAANFVTTVSNTRTIIGRNSVQGIIKELSRGITLESGHVQKGATVTVISEELRTLLVDDPMAHPILTTLYDTHAHLRGWKNTLKETKETLQDVCINLLGASNLDMLSGFLPKSAYTGGFIGRTMISIGEGRRCINPMIDDADPLDFSDAIEHLREVAKLEGKFEFTPEARAYFNHWYKHDFHPERVDDKTGTIERMQDHALKMAMNISMSHSLDKKITEGDIREAIDLMLSIFPNTRQVASQATGTMPGEVRTKIVLWELIQAPGNTMSRTRMLQKNWGMFSAQELDEVINTFLQSRAITVQQGVADDGEKDTFYTLKPHVAARFNKFVEEG